MIAIEAGLTVGGAPVDSVLGFEEWADRMQSPELGFQCRQEGGRWRLFRYYDPAEIVRGHTDLDAQAKALSDTVRGVFTTLAGCRPQQLDQS
jgi:hypothetical protein